MTWLKAFWERSEHKPDPGHAHDNNTPHNHTHSGAHGHTHGAVDPFILTNQNYSKRHLGHQVVIGRVRHHRSAAVGHRHAVGECGTSLRHHPL